MQKRQTKICLSISMSFCILQTAYSLINRPL
nr:MAG TPA: hypothetical protein [Caudoviricetes sp.]